MNSGDNTDATFAPRLVCLVQSTNRSRFPLRSADLREPTVRQYQTLPCARRDRFHQPQTTRADRASPYASARNSLNPSSLARPQLKNDSLSSLLSAYLGELCVTAIARLI